MPASPAPHGFFGDEAFLPPSEVIDLDNSSLKSHRTALSQISLTSLGGIQIQTRSQGSKTPETLRVSTTNGKLPPLQNHQVLVRKLSQSKPQKRKKEKQAKSQNDHDSRSRASTPITVLSPNSEDLDLYGFASTD